MISLISTINQNTLIPYHNHLPSTLPHHLNFFNPLTIPHPIIIPTKTFQSIPNPLPPTQNILITP
ncbi:dihydrofolate reductase, partial [Cytobacillus oceanisediminis]|uniref:dihydrofolate reductase n=1 Tax=Cytobacillus oceanisediminis TaxID=665099 RepID=UPI00119D356C